MNREHWKELLPVITAFANGEDVQIKDGDDWLAVVSPSFREPAPLYRIAPKPRKVWINEYLEDGNSVFKSHATRQAADDFATEGRIACHEIELPPLP